jgi:hypothetical protein
MVRYIGSWPSTVCSKGTLHTDDYMYACCARLPLRALNQCFVLITNATSMFGITRHHIRHPRTRTRRIVSYSTG